MVFEWFYLSNTITLKHSRTIFSAAMACTSATASKFKKVVGHELEPLEHAVDPRAAIGVRRAKVHQPAHRRDALEGAGAEERS